MTVISTHSIGLKKVRETLDYSSGQLLKNFRISIRELDTPSSRRVSRDCPLDIRISSASDVAVVGTALPFERELETSSGISEEGWLGIRPTLSNPMTQVAQDGSERMIESLIRILLTYSIWIGVSGEVENQSKSQISELRSQSQSQ